MCSSGRGKCCESAWPELGVAGPILQYMEEKVGLVPCPVSSCTN